MIADLVILMLVIGYCVFILMRRHRQKKNGAACFGCAGCSGCSGACAGNCSENGISWQDGDGLLKKRS
ncbi:MAG: FeoB-associated Cys-rich membrane protein [Clostridiales bacterium]|nr:MAG: FeoB-associated Cys-rich membrane protein [Clostridiales bacterium]HJA32133.1 FeoB-associated Cys-rich membrane protein [Candidatus Eisenbergiella pullicola]